MPIVGQPTFGSVSIASLLSGELGSRVAKATRDPMTATSGLERMSAMKALTTVAMYGLVPLPPTQGAQLTRDFKKLSRTRQPYVDDNTI